MKNHIHIVGFKRSGTTLMHQLFRCFKDTWVTDAGGVHLWDVKVPPTVTASNVVSKYTKDALHMDRCLAVPHTKLLYMIRDPRDTLASRFRGREGYASNPEKLVRRITALGDSCFPRSGVFVVRYEDLVRDPNGTQQVISNYFALEVDVLFTEGYKRFNPGTGEFALNGIRPIDTNSIGNWSTSEHVGRVTSVLEEFPEIREFTRRFYGLADDT